jgi:hypothetical protein
MTTVEALQSPSNYGVHTKIFFAVIASITTIWIAGPQIHEMATFDSGFGDYESSGTDYPSPGECQVLWSHVKDAQGRHFEALAKGYDDTIVGLRYQEMTAAELQYKQRCDPTFILTRDRHFPH